jgi:hypothetical protein
VLGLAGAKAPILSPAWTGIRVSKVFAPLWMEPGEDSATVWNSLGRPVERKIRILSDSVNPGGTGSAELTFHFVTTPAAGAATGAPPARESCTIV